MCEQANLIILAHCCKGWLGMKVEFEVWDVIEPSQWNHFEVSMA